MDGPLDLQVSPAGMIREITVALAEKQISFPTRPNDFERERTARLILIEALSQLRPEFRAALEWLQLAEAVDVSDHEQIAQAYDAAATVLSKLASEHWDRVEGAL